MKMETAQKIVTGEIIPIVGEDCSLHEAFMLCAGACLEDNGDLTCIKCGLPNECCHCGEFDGEA